MKNLKLVVTLVVFAMVATSVGIAGPSKAGKLAQPTTPQGRTMRFLSPVKDSDVPAGRALKSSPMNFRSLVAKNPLLSKPVPLAKNPSSVTAKLSGVYHIPGDIASLGVAVQVANLLGLSGNTTFELDDSSYSEGPITFGSWPGNDTYTLTVSPGPGIPVVFTFESDSLHGKGFAFVGAKNVTIDGLNAGGASLSLVWDEGAPFPLGDPFGSTVYITGGSDHIAVKNASVQGNVNTPVWVNQSEGRSAIFIYAADADPNFNTNITFDGLTITRATYGIKCLPESPAVTVDGLTIQNCKIGGAYGDPVAIGGFYEYPVNVLFAHNVIDGSEFLDWYWNNAYTEYDVDVAFGVGPIFFNLGQSTGSHFISVDAGVFHDNIIRNVSVNGVAGEGLLSYGTRISQGNDGLGITASVYNNRVYNVSNPGGAGAQITGIRGTAGDVYHNSIQLTGVVVGAGTVARCLNGVSVAYNNALSNEMTGPTPANITAIVPGGTIDYNAAHSTIGRSISGFATAAAAAAAGINANGTSGAVNFTADLHLNPAGPSSAENMGKPHVLAKNDIDGDARDTTIAGTRDAGADEVSAALTNAPGPDVGVGLISSPNSGGVPAGLAQTPVVVVKNNTNQTAGPFNVELKVNDGYDQVVSVTLTPQQTKSVTFPTWTPPASLTNYTDTLTASTALGGDVNAADNTLERTQAVQAPVTLTTDTTYTWNSGAQGWTGTNDFVRDNAFTKLGGPVDSYAWVTEEPNDHSLYTEGANANTEGYSATYPGPNLLISPWFNLSAFATDVYVSFQHSIQTEPGWDGSWVDYTTDGVNWHHLGALNDAHGINWYAQSVYANALSGNGTGGGPVDTATMLFPQYNLYGPGSDNPTLPMPFWTSNGAPGPPLSVGAETAPQGPDGWIFTQLHLTAAQYPTIVGAPLVKFRYVAFSDALTAYAGWAVDNFHVGPNGASFTGGVIKGTVFTDVNGNAVDDAEPGVSGAKIYLKYFGVLKDSTTTDGSGNYSFNTNAHNNGLPGTYNVVVSGQTLAFSLPFYSNTANINHDGLGDTVVQNFGLYNGSVAGHAISDLNNNGVTDGGEPGLFHWVVEVHKDSLHGVLVDSIFTDASGAYSFNLPLGNYVLKILSPLELIGSPLATHRATAPLTGVNAISISGNSGSGTAVLTGVDFEEYLFNIIRTVCAIDVNGNGLKEPTDFAALTTGATQVFKFYHNGVFVSFDTVGNTAGFSTHYADTGSYSVMRFSPNPPVGWLKTTATDSFSFTVTTGALFDSATYLYYKMGTASGRFFSDRNANGVEDTLETGLAGWTVNISGAGGGTVVTDSLGNWVITTLQQGPHTVTEGVPLAGFTPTLTPLPATLTWANQLSGSSNANNHVALDFGKFKNVTVSGTVYRDRNHNGVRDAGEEAVAGVTVSLTGQTNVVSDANGLFTFTNVPPTPDTVSLSATAPVGFSVTSGPFSIILLSGDTTQQTRTLGVFNNTDNTKYRTWTAAQLLGGASTKVQKAWTAKKPTVPTLANMLNTVFLTQAALVKVGVSGALNPSGKEYPYIVPAKYSDAFATFSAKGVGHTGSPRGLDVDVKGSLLLKKYKSIPETKKNDVLIADLLAFKINIASSATGVVNTGNFGALIYHEAGNPLSGKTLTQIGAAADSAMTLWAGVPYTTYVMYDSVLAKVNAAFSDTTVPYDTAAWNVVTSVYHAKGVKTVYQVPFLSANPGAAPTQVVGGKVPTVPASYKLEQNYPNPFNPTTSITFEVPGPAVVTIKVYNMLGQEVVTLLNNQVYDFATRDNVDFNGANLASGVYFYRIVAQSLDDNGVATSKTFTQVKKMLLVK